MARRSSDSPTLLRPAGPDFALETGLLAAGAHRIAGVDEAGRGPLAGPVVAAAVVLDATAIPAGLNDSKALKAAERERLFGLVLLAAKGVAVGSASAGEIDRLNIRQATLLAMRRAVAALPFVPDHCLVDGLDLPAAWQGGATAVVGGDARSLSIAAASIVAKVLRDRMMVRLAEAYPAYGFHRHMGYGTAEHRAALQAHGPCPHHRRSFAPMRDVMGTEADRSTSGGSSSRT